MKLLSTDNKSSTPLYLGIKIILEPWTPQVSKCASSYYILQTQHNNMAPSKVDAEVASSPAQDDISMQDANDADIPPGDGREDDKIRIRIVSTFWAEEYCGGGKQ